MCATELKQSLMGNVEFYTHLSRKKKGGRWHSIQEVREKKIKPKGTRSKKQENNKSKRRLDEI